MEQNVNRNTHSLVTCYFIKPHQFLFETFRLRIFIHPLLVFCVYDYGSCLTKDSIYNLIRQIDR